MRKLSIGQKHVLKLIGRDEGVDGWTPVSEALYQSLKDNTPGELAEFEKLDKGGRARLTERGKSVFYAMSWI